MPSQQWNLVDALKTYSRVLAIKMLFIAVGWVAVYFISQPFRGDNEKAGINLLTLFAPMLGAIAGLVAGWYIATDAVEDSNMHGLTLWVILVVGAVSPMWGVEGIMHLIRPQWTVGFGGYMVVMSANLLALASAVWLASSQE